MIIVFAILFIFLFVGIDVVYAKKKRYHAVIEGKWDKLQQIEYYQDIKNLWASSNTYFIIRSPRGNVRVCACNRESYTKHDVGDTIYVETTYGFITNVRWTTTYIR